jgi:hypothetical protein
MMAQPANEVSPRHQSGKGWNQLKIDHAIDGHLDGLSAREIAVQCLHGEFTRNAVVGKLYRLKESGAIELRRVWRKIEGKAEAKGIAKPKADPIVLEIAEPNPIVRRNDRCRGLIGAEYCGGTLQPGSSARLCAQCNSMHIRSRPRDRYRYKRSLSDPAGFNW